MPLSHVVDFDGLLAPISDDAPHGTDVRTDRSPVSDYYQLKDARNGARTAERAALMGDTEADVLGPWQTVAELAPKILTEAAKDLEVACWYLESLVRLHGIAGLRDGMILVERLIDEYWDNLYPEPDEDGMETKVAPLTGLNGDGGDGTLMVPIRNLPITVEGDYGEFSFWQYQQARDADKIEDEDAKSARFETLGYSMEQVGNTIKLTTPDLASDFVEGLNDALERYKAFGQTLRQHCGGDAPPSSNISNLLDEVLRTARFIYKDALEALAAKETEATPSESELQETDAMTQNTVSGQPAAANVASGPINNREEALLRLEEVARFFRMYEPHTPIASSLERVVGWGRMTVAELMMELLPDQQARGIYSQLTGVALDGSDDHTYVAPPAVSTADYSEEPSATAPTSDAEPQQEDVGW